MWSHFWHLHLYSSKTAQNISKLSKLYCAHRESCCEKRPLPHPLSIYHKLHVGRLKQRYFVLQWNFPTLVYTLTRVTSALDQGSHMEKKCVECASMVKLSLKELYVLCYTYRITSVKQKPWFCHTYVTHWKQWLLCVPPGLTYKNSTFRTQRQFMRFVWIRNEYEICNTFQHSTAEET